MSTEETKIVKKPKDISFDRLLDPIIKPIMSEQVEEDVLDLLVMYQKKDIWNAWGLNKIRKQGSGALLRGPSGTGKTMIAKWVARRLGKGCKILDMSMVGGGDPGQCERSIRDFFADARKRGWATIFLDECDNILANRATISDDTWKLGSVETIMMEINIYAGMVLAATNHPEKLDPALANRFMAIIDVGEPDRIMRKRLWKQKWPERFPMHLTDDALVRLSRFELNGRQIETVLIRVGSHAIRKGIKPKLPLFELFCEAEKGKHIETEGE